MLFVRGGEPTLQLDTPLVEALHGRGFEIAIETQWHQSGCRRRGLDLRQPQGGSAGGADEWAGTETGVPPRGK